MKGSDALDGGGFEPTRIAIEELDLPPIPLFPQEFHHRALVQDEQLGGASPPDGALITSTRGTITTAPSSETMRWWVCLLNAPSPKASSRRMGEVRPSQRRWVMSVRNIRTPSRMNPRIQRKREAAVHRPTVPAR